MCILKIFLISYFEQLVSHTACIFENTSLSIKLHYTNYTIQLTLNVRIGLPMYGCIAVYWWSSEVHIPRGCVSKRKKKNEAWMQNISIKDRVNKQKQINPCFRYHSTERQSKQRASTWQCFQQWKWIPTELTSKASSAGIWRGLWFNLKSTSLSLTTAFVMPNGFSFLLVTE